MSIKLVMPSNHLILCHPFLLLPSILPRIRVFSSESVLCIRWPTYWSFSFSICPSNEYLGLISFRMDWLDLLAVQGTLKSLLQHHISKASILWARAQLLPLALSLVLGGSVWEQSLSFTPLDKNQVSQAGGLSIFFLKPRHLRFYFFILYNLLCCILNNILTYEYLVLMLDVSWSFEAEGEISVQSRIHSSIFFSSVFLLSFWHTMWCVEWKEFKIGFVHSGLTL